MKNAVKQIYGNQGISLSIPRELLLHKVHVHAPTESMIRYRIGYRTCSLRFFVTKLHIIFKYQNE